LSKSWKAGIKKDIEIYIFKIHKDFEVRTEINKKNGRGTDN